MFFCRHPLEDLLQLPFEVGFQLGLSPSEESCTCLLHCSSALLSYVVPNYGWLSANNPPPSLPAVAPLRHPCPCSLSQNLNRTAAVVVDLAIPGSGSTKRALNGLYNRVRPIQNDPEG